jgi:hypothetical protein
MSERFKVVEPENVPVTLKTGNEPTNTTDIEGQYTTKTEDIEQYTRGRFQTVTVP